jgi:hypothetical protein
MNYANKYKKYREKYKNIKTLDRKLFGGSVSDTGNMLIHSRENYDESDNILITTDISNEYTIIDGLIDCIAVFVYFLDNNQTIKMLMSLHFVKLHDSHDSVNSIKENITNNLNNFDSIKICLWCNSVNPNSKGKKCNSKDNYVDINTFFYNLKSELFEIQDINMEIIGPIKGTRKIYSQKIDDLFLNPCLESNDCNNVYYGTDNPYDKLSRFNEYMPEPTYSFFD